MDIWPDIGRFNVQQALDTVHACTDPFILSLFRDHRCAMVRNVTSEKLIKIRTEIGRTILRNKIKAA